MKTLTVLSLLLLLSFNDSIFPQDEPYICKYLFASSNEITKFATDAISIGVDAVWEASGITGVVTTTGTLTQNPVNPDIWTYAPTPGDKLILNFANSASLIFTFYSIDGYKDGTEDDFKWSHLMDFNIFNQGWFNIRITSNTYPQNGIIYWQRTITGNTLFDSQNMTLNITHTGSIDYDISSGYAYYKYTEHTSGSSSSGSFSINVNEGYVKTIIHNSNVGLFASNTEIINNSTGNFNGTPYKYQNAHVFWAAGTGFLDSAYAGFYNNVIDGYQWLAEGLMLKNDQQYGTVQFDGPVNNGSYGPNLVLHLNNGNDILLHTLIAFPATDVSGEEIAISGFELMQNYPNPFNPITVISYQLPVGSNVTLKIFNSLGKEIETLVNEYKPAGSYEVEFNAYLCSSGVYFYRINAGRYSSVKKMLLLR
jgi:hypothetical protein